MSFIKLMKRVLSFFILFCFLFNICSLFCSADNKNMNDIEYFEDGSYAITSIIVNHSLLSASNSITRTKKYEFFDSTNQLCWAAFLTASFTYNGTTSSCTGASCDVTIYNNSWSTKSVNAYTSGYSAIAEVTIIRKLLFITVETKSFSITLSCDRYGNLT